MSRATAVGAVGRAVSGHIACFPRFLNAQQQKETRMPKAWSNKDERQYQHIQDSEKKRGRSSRRAKEIAARTVNKNRRQRGDTPNRTTQGTGNPNSALEQRSRDELYNRAKQLGVKGRSSMTKDDLIRAIQANA
jgi:hypothetical protein